MPNQAPGQMKNGKQNSIWNHLYDCWDIRFERFRPPNHICEINVYGDRALFRTPFLRSGVREYHKSLSAVAQIA